MIINIIHHLLEKNYVDKILVVPTLNYWDKVDLIDVHDRINMLKFFETENIIIDTKHNDCIYTNELVQKVKLDYPDYKISIIMGADNVINLDKWKDYQKLLQNNIIVINRDNIDVLKYTKKLNGDFTIINDLKQMNISSTNIRKKLSSKYLDSRVIDYIKKNNLYQ